MKELKNLKKAIQELNNENCEGEYFFDFKLKEVKKGVYHLYDKNETYHINFAEDNYYMECDLADEFGFKKPASYTDRIYNTLNEALKKDLGENAILDWYDNVTLVFCA